MFAFQTYNYYLEVKFARQSELTHLIPFLFWFPFLFQQYFLLR